jgi:hypothetical protein
MLKVVVIIWRVDHGVPHDAVGQASAAGSNTAVGALIILAATASPCKPGGSFYFSPRSRLSLSQLIL